MKVTINEEIDYNRIQNMSLEEMISCITEKDWRRAETIPFQQYATMLNRITHTEKLVGRVLAIFFYQHMHHPDYLDWYYARPEFVISRLHMHNDDPRIAQIVAYAQEHYQTPEEREASRAVGGFFDASGNLREEFVVEEKRELRTIPAEDVRKVVLQYVKENGYVSGGYGYHNNNGTSYRQSPTVEEIYRILRNEDNLEPYRADEETFREMNAYVQNLIPEDRYAEFKERCKEVWAKEHYEKSDLSLLAACCSSFFSNKAYQKRQQERAEKDAAHEAEVASEANVWVGTVGQDVEFVISEAKIIYYINVPTYHGGSYPVWAIKDAEGHTFIVSDTSGTWELEPGDKIKGKIQSHTEFRGIKQTKLWRASIEQAGRTGFFTLDGKLKEDYDGERSWDDLEYWEKAWRLNNIVSSFNDERAYYNDWIFIWPDGETEEDCKYHFGEEADYKELEDIFKEIYSAKKYRKGGLYLPRKAEREQILKDAHMWDERLHLEPIEYHDGSQWVK